MVGRIERYIVFGGSAYYAEGGALDIKVSFKDLDSALAWIRGTPDRREDLEDGVNWCHVLDTETGLIVAANDGAYCGSIKEFPNRLAPSLLNLRTEETSDD